MRINFFLSAPGRLVDLHQGGRPADEDRVLGTRAIKIGTVAMRPALLVLAALGMVLIGAGAASVTDQTAVTDPGGISTAALSRCAGVAGLEIREADASFGELMLDGVPWFSAQYDDQAVVLSSTGALRRRSGTVVPFRFLCVIDDRKRATLFRIISAGVDETLPLSRSVNGVAVPVGHEGPLARGAELRVQLLDIKKDPTGELLAEQVVRSSGAAPIPFALRVPTEVTLNDSHLVITARIVLARTVTYRMERPVELPPDELQRPVRLDLSPE